MALLPILILCVLVASPADAHVVEGAHVMEPGRTRVTIGLIQPFFKVALAMAAIASGLLAGQNKGLLPNRVALLFLAGVLLGLGMALLSMRPDVPFYLVYVLSLVLGLLVAAAFPLKRFLIVPVFGSVGLLIGIISATESVSSMTNVYGTLGSLIAIALLFRFGVMASQWLVSRDGQPWLSVAVRVFGSWIAAVSLMLIALSYRG